MRDGYERYKGPAAVSFVVGAFLLGLVGWRLTRPQASWSSTLYDTVALFGLNFNYDGDPHWTLDVARFLAAFVVFWAAFVVAYRVISRRGAARRAGRLRHHVVVVGESTEARLVADQYRSRGREVVVIGDLDPTDAAHLVRRKTVVVPVGSGADELRPAELARIVGGAERVVVLGGDTSAEERVGRLRSACRALPPTTVLFENRDMAATWAHAHGDVALCRSTQVALAILRAEPPYLEDAMVTPPVVAGDGEGAAELARRIVVGWQQPGERLTVWCLGTDESWVERARLQLDERADLRFVATPPSASAVRDAVIRCWEDWERPEKLDRFTVASPTVYVAYDDVAVTIPIASAVADALPNPRVVGLVDNSAAWIDSVSPTRARLVSRRALLGDPGTLELDPVALLANEIIADAGRWPRERPSALGVITPSAHGPAQLADQSPEVRGRALALASSAESVLAAGGVTLEQRTWASDAVSLLAPHQLEAVASRVELAMGADPEADQRETRLRHLELAARLPTLAARSGWTPTASESAHPLTDAALQQLAVLAHGVYEEVSHLTDNATRSANFGKAWEALSEVDQRSNIAQVADIPVKLATVGLTWRVSNDPIPFAFTAEQVEELAENEHRRWSHFQYRNGRPGHEWNQTWAELTQEAEETGKDAREYDRAAVRKIPHMLASIGLEIV